MNLAQFFSVLTPSADAPASTEGAALKQTLPEAWTRMQMPLDAPQTADSKSAQFSDAQMQVLREFAHDMRTPLASILALCEQMKQSVEGDVTSAERTLNHARLLMRMMDGFIAQSRAEGARLQKSERVVADLLEESLEQVRDLASQRGIALKLADAASCCFVQVASDLVVRAFNNLLVNAVKYGEPGSAIQIQWRCHQGDNGASVTLEVANRIATVPDPSPGVTKSCGLGLDFVRKVVAMHEGRFELDLQQEGFAHARLTLPCEIEPI